MPTQIKISKEMILDAAFDIVRLQGMEKLSNRELANKLKCSIRPIYYQFENVKDLQKELYKKITYGEREKEKVVIVGIEPTTSALLARRSDRLS